MPTVFKKEKTKNAILSNLSKFLKIKITNYKKLVGDGEK